MKLASSIVYACLFGACNFDLQLGATSDAGGDGGGSADSAVIDAPVGPPVDCVTASAANLVACFELEDNVTDGTLRDSSDAHRDATTRGLEPVQRTKPSTSEAANVLSTVSTYAPDSPSFDLAAGYTVTMWVRPTSVPPTSKVLGLYDHELQYAGAIAKSAGPDAHLRCINTNNAYMYTNTIPINTWSFIACTWDGTNLCAQYWSTPTEHERYCAQTTISEDGNMGLAIGHLSDNGVAEQPLDGSLDSVQVYNRSLNTTELCTMIGQPSTCLQ